MIVLDTSAWLKRVLRHERDADKVEALAQLHLSGQEQIAVPYVVWSEAVYVLSNRLRFPWPRMREAVGLLWLPQLKVIPPTRRLLAASIDIGEQYGIKNPDAIFAAAAWLRRCFLLTDDEHMSRQMRQHGIQWVRALREYDVTSGPGSGC